jgi:hypothetical protein
MFALILVAPPNRHHRTPPLDRCIDNQPSHWRVNDVTVPVP